MLPGRTVFVGDSFTAVALCQLAQLSQETVFVWTDSTAPLQPMLDEIAQGDRVVVEVVERFATRYRMFRPDVVEGVRALPPRRPVPGSSRLTARRRRHHHPRGPRRSDRGWSGGADDGRPGPVLLAAVLLVGARPLGPGAAAPDCTADRRGGRRSG